MRIFMHDIWSICHMCVILWLRESMHTIIVRFDESKQIWNNEKDCGLMFSSLLIIGLTFCLTWINECWRKRFSLYANKWSMKWKKHIMNVKKSSFSFVYRFSSLWCFNLFFSKWLWWWWWWREKKNKMTLGVPDSLCECET